MYHHQQKQTSLNKPVKNFQEVFSPELTKLDEAALNKNDQMQFSPEKD